MSEKVQSQNKPFMSFSFDQEWIFSAINDLKEEILKEMRKEYREETKKLADRVQFIGDKNDRKFKLYDKKISNSCKDIQDALSRFKIAMETLEETIFCIYHNIKQNQFLYSYDPNAVMETFDKMRSNLIKENKKLENYIKV